MELSIAALEPSGPMMFCAFIRDISDRCRADERRDVQYAVTRSLANSDTLERAFSQTLSCICEMIHWDYGMRTAGPG